MTLQPGDILHTRYKIETIIAQGGMGAVYRARDLSLDVLVAVKENLGTTESYARQFRREGTVLASLVHPNLPRVTDHFVSETGSQYLVMDFIEGEDLREMIKRQGQLPEEFVLRVGIEICEALSYLHTRQPPILHRDIKPGNIKISPDGSIFLVDFGLVKVVQGGGATTTGAQSLTPGYAPPEQYGGGTDQRSDIYSLGATLYAALTGKIPEDGISRAMGNSRLTPILRHNPGVSPRLAATIEKSLSIEPEKRFQTALEFRDQLIELWAGYESTERNTTVPVQPSEKTRKTSSGDQKRKSSTRNIIAAVLAILVFLGLVIAAESLSRVFLRGPVTMSVATPTEERSKPPQATRTMRVQVTDPGTSALPASTLTSDPEPTSIPVDKPGEMIAFASDREGIPQIYLVSLEDASLTKITTLQEGACQPDWSPDGRRLIFISPCAADAQKYPNASLFLMNADGSNLQGLNTVPGGDFEPDWTADPNLILFSSLRDSTNYSTSHLFLFNLAEGKSTRIPSNANAQQNPRMSPSGGRITFIENRNGIPQVFLMNTDGSEPSALTSLLEGGAAHPAWSPDGTRVVYVRLAPPSGMMLKNAELPGSKSLSLNDQFPDANNPAFSTDGSLIVFESGGDIWMMQASGENPVNLTQSAGRDFDPAWRPQPSQ